MYIQNLLPKNCIIEPYYPYSWPAHTWPHETWIGDFPPLEDKRRKDDLQKDLAKIWKDSSWNTSELLKSSEKQIWFNNTDGSVSFKLEVVGYGQEHISVEIKDSTLHISGKRGQKSFSQQHQIPLKLDLNNVSAKVEHGLLEIVFSAKKTEVKSVKIL